MKISDLETNLILFTDIYSGKKYNFAFKESLILDIS